VTGLEVIELSAAAVTAVDYAAVVQDVVRLSGAGGANTTVSNVRTNDVLVITADQAGVTGAAAKTFAGALPGQTMRIEIFGSGIDLTNGGTADTTDDTLEFTSGISTLQLDSSKAATDTSTTANTIVGSDGSSGTTDYAFDNQSLSSIILTGNHALTISDADAATNVAAGTFSSAISFDATAFAANLSIITSSAADVIIGGTKNDTIQGAGGNDQIDLTAGGVDKVVFNTGATNGRDTITGFGSTDTINVAALGDGSTGTLQQIISAAAAQGALVDDRAYIINTSGAAANLTTGGTATVSDFTNATQVAAYLAERFTLAGNDDEAVIVINVTGTSTSYVYSIVDGNSTWAAADVTLAGVITRDTALDAANVVFA